MLVVAASLAKAEMFLGQGTMSGEVTATTALVQTRLTQKRRLDRNGDMKGQVGRVCFQWGTDALLSGPKRTAFQDAIPEHDFIVRESLVNLQPNTTYYYRAVYGQDDATTEFGPTCHFKTLPGIQSDQSVKFIVGSCMNYNKFMYGKQGNAGGPITATSTDKKLGFPAFETMAKIKPDFFVGTGDIVYYDNPYRVSTTTEELRRCWHEQFRFPRMIDFFREVPTYWSKDDHDFRYNDSDNTTDRLPTRITGIDLFREQLPIATQFDTNARTYRTHRINRNLQIWLTEGRDFRSPNRSPDGPAKSLWGIQQKQWLQKTLLESDAKWKIIINPTPMVGPDMAKKTDNHVSLGGFRHEADDFFGWLNKNNIGNLLTICGDRHWQYHSIHPLGVQEFACGALNDENSRMGVDPGSRQGTDPNSLIQQPFTSPEPRGGFLVVGVRDKLTLSFHTADGQQLYTTTK